MAILSVIGRQVNMSFDEAVSALTRLGFERSEARGHTVFRKGRTMFTLSRGGYVHQMTASNIHKLEATHDAKQAKLHGRRTKVSPPPPISLNGEPIHLTLTKEIPMAQPDDEPVTPIREESLTSSPLGEWVTTTRRLVRHFNVQITRLEAQLGPLIAKRDGLVSQLKEIGGEGSTVDLSSTPTTKAPPGKRRGRYYDQATKDRVKMMWVDGRLRISEMAEQTRVTTSTIYTWIKEWKKERDAAKSQ